MLQQLNEECKSQITSLIQLFEKNHSTPEAKTSFVTQMEKIIQDYGYNGFFIEEIKTDDDSLLIKVRNISTGLENILKVF
jgi:hypothetical protein